MHTLGFDLETPYPDVVNLYTVHTSIYFKLYAYFYNIESVTMGVLRSF